MLRTPLLILCLWLVIPLSVNNAVAASAEDARQFVDNVGKQVLEIINGNEDEKQKQEQLRRMFSENVDIDWMGKFALGRAWNQATEAQKKRYLQAYRQYLLARYTANFADYAGSKYVITGAKSESEGQFTVAMQIKSPHQKEQETEAGYRVRDNGSGQFKITDIIIEGISLIITERADFGSVLQQKGLDALIGDIEAKAKTEPHAIQNGAPKNNE